MDGFPSINTGLALHAGGPDGLSARLAFDLASELTPLKAVQLRYGLADEDLRALLANESFGAMVREARAKWTSALNAKERVRLKALIALEDSIINLFTIANNPDTPATARTDAIRQMSRIAGTEASDEGGAGKGSGPGFQITMVFGGKELVIDGKADPATAVANEPVVVNVG